MARKTSPIAVFSAKPAWSDPITSFITGSLSQRFFRRRHHVLHGESEFLEQILQRSRGAKRVHANHFSSWPDIPLPTECRAHLHGNARGHFGKNAVFVR